MVIGNFKHLIILSDFFMIIQKNFS